MTYDQQTAVRLVCAVVADGASVYCKPVRRAVLQSLLDALDAQDRELAWLRQLHAAHKEKVSA